MSTPRTHPVNVTHLVLGLVFLGIAGAWALRRAELVDTGEARWALPIILLVAGLAGLAASVTKAVAARRAPGQDTIEDPDLPPWADRED